MLNEPLQSYYLTKKHCHRMITPVSDAQRTTLIFLKSDAQPTTPITLKTAMCLLQF